MNTFTRFAFLALAGFLASVLSACGGSGEPVPERAHDPWVFRSVLDGRPRMVTLALHDNLWAAYSAQTGALYKVWKGSVNFDGAVYTTVHGPQPGTLGPAYIENKYEEPWKIVRGGREERPQIQYRGHRFRDGRVTLHTELRLGDGAIVHVFERPEYVEKESGQIGFERVFTAEGIPEDAALFLETNISSVALAGNIVAEGGAFQIRRSTPRQVDDIRAMDVDGELALAAGGSTRFVTWFTRRPLLENPNRLAGSGEEDLPAGLRLINRSDCKTCHNTYVKTVGPAYVDVARKYANNERNISSLIAKVKDGGAGVWGEAAMTAHPDLDEGDIRAMIEYIMGLDAGEEAEMAAFAKGGASPDIDYIEGAGGMNEADLFPGAIVSVMSFDRDLTRLADVDFGAEPIFRGIVPVIRAGDAELDDLGNNFAILLTGYLKIPQDNNFVFRLLSDDGSRLTIDSLVVINHDGLHGADPKDGEIALRAGYHPFRLEFFQAGGGKSLDLQWRSFDSPEFATVPAAVFVHRKADEPSGAGAAVFTAADKQPGDRAPVAGVHPSYTLTQARPNDFLPKVGGMDFLSDGRLVVSTWDPEGGVYILDGVQSGDPARITVKKIAQGLAEPLGLKVVDDTIYVLQKQELTRLIDHDGDEVIDEYYTLANSWRVSANFHEFSFGLVYKDDWFYGALAIAILPGGASANPQIPDRGKAIRVHRRTGELQFVAEGLRTPNGVGIGVDGEIFIADNQGDWLPSSKILHVTPGAFFGSRAVDSARVAGLPVKLPVVWLPQDEIGNSPSTPAWLNDGPYKGQMIHGEVTHGGVKRVFVERVGGEYQGAVFRFTQGLEAGVNRLVWGPDGALYTGGVGSSGNWSHAGGLWYGLQRLQYNGQPAFEMLAVRAKSNGMEIEFTEPLAAGLGADPAAYTVQQWRYQPTANYGGPKLDLETLTPRTVRLSADRRRAFLELGAMKPGRVVYVRLPAEWTSEGGRRLWSTETWYTLNRIPAAADGAVDAPPASR